MFSSGWKDFSNVLNFILKIFHVWTISPQRSEGNCASQRSKMLIKRKILAPNLNPSSGHFFQIQIHKARELELEDDPFTCLTNSKARERTPQKKFATTPINSFATPLLRMFCHPTPKTVLATSYQKKIATPPSIFCCPTPQKDYWHPTLKRHFAIYPQKLFYHPTSNTFCHPIPKFYCQTTPQRVFVMPYSKRKLSPTPENWWICWICWKTCIETKIRLLYPLHLFTHN